MDTEASTVIKIPTSVPVLRFPPDDEPLSEAVSVTVATTFITHHNSTTRNTIPILRSLVTPQQPVIIQRSCL